MGTTLTALALAGTTAYIAHVGDTRVYRLRNKSMTLLTQDHSEVADMIRMKLVTPAMATNHPSRNVLTRTIGHHLMLRPDFARESVQPDDVFVLCTDGVWSEIDDLEIAELAASANPENACQQMIDVCLQRECDDNVSVQVIRVIDVDHAAQQAHHRPTFLGSLIDRIR